MKTALLAAPFILHGQASSAESPEGRFICDQTEEPLAAFGRVSMFGQERAFSELAEIKWRCSEANWDGDGAIPVHPVSLSMARRFLQAYSLEAGGVSAGADPDGEVTLEWHVARNRTLSISFSKGGDLHYAALIGPERLSGTVPFLGDVPRFLHELIRRVTG